LDTDWSGLGEARDAQAREKERSVELDRALAVAERCAAMRRRVVRELLDGRLDLFSAAAQFQYLNRLTPYADTALANRYPRMSTGERACRHLLDWLKMNTLGTPAWGACGDLHARLETELNDYLRTHGEVKLPQPPWLRMDNVPRSGCEAER
jgi:hypothetical protein